MPKRAQNNPRQIRVKTCGCALCIAAYPDPPRARRRDCVGSWQARWRDPAGKPKARNFPTKKQAEAHLDKVHTQIRERTYVDATRGNLKVRDWYALYLETVEGADTTLVRDESLWRNHVETKWGGWSLADVSYLEVKGWVAALRKTHAPGTIIKIFQIFDRLMTAALRDKRIPFNPCDGVVLPKAKAKHPEDRRPPTYDQLDLIRVELPEYHHALTIVAQETGLRWGELVGLRRCYVDLKRARIQVREVLIEVRASLQRQGYPKTNAGLRTVPLTPLAVGVLTAHLEKYPASKNRSSVEDGLREDELVFRGRNGKALRRYSFRRLWTAATQAAGVARLTKDPKTGRTEWWPTVHSVRHAFASRLADLNVPEVVVQEILGQERGGSVTWLYTHAASDVAGQVLAALTQERPRLVAV